MATTRIKDLSKTATTVASDANIVIDGPSNGTQKITRDNFRQDTADAFVAAPSTYKLAPLNGVNKIDATYLPTSSDTPKGEWNASSNSPALADGSGVAGDYYDVTTAGTANLGSGPIDFTVGDVIKYNGSTWFKIDSVANILDGSATAADGRSALSVNSKNEDAQANALKTTAPSTYFNGTSSVVTVADDDKLSFTSLTEFGKTTAGTWSPEDNTPALTDGTGTLNDHYKIDADGTVAQGGSTLSIIDGASVTAGQVVYYDGSVWRVKDCDDLPFSISAWVKPLNVVYFLILTKSASAPNREWLFWTNGDGRLYFWLRDTLGNYLIGTGSTILTADEWTHVAVSFAGAGTNSANSFVNAISGGVNMYVNGAAETVAATASGTYTGMSNTSAPVSIGEAGGAYSKGSIRDVKIFNRELTSTEVAELARGNDLGFADEWGGVNGGLDTSNFASTTDGYSASQGTVTGNEDSIGGENDWLKLTLNTSTAIHQILSPQVMPVGARVRVEFDCYIPSTNSHVDGVKANLSSTITSEVIATNEGATTDTVFRVSGEGIATGNQRVYITALDGSSTTVSDSGGDDWIAIKNVKITQLGKIADFRAEDYNESASKLLDRSSNNFVGVGTSVTLTGNQRHISADTIDLKNLPTSSAGLSAGEVWSNGGVLTVV